MIKAIIFDLDGLLINSEPTWRKTITEFLHNKGIDYTSKARNKSMGAGHREVIEVFKKNLDLKGDTDDLVEEMRSHFYKVFLQNPRLMTGAKKFLERTHGNNLLLTIATGLGPRNRVMSLLSELGVENYFKVIITGDEVTKGKPDPQIYLISAEKIGVKPAECLVLEDSTNGVVAGKAAGMTVFGVNEDEKIKGSLVNAGADKIFSNLLEIEI